MLGFIADTIAGGRSAEPIPIERDERPFCVRETDFPVIGKSGAPPHMPVRERPYDYYETHPEHRPRPLTARQIRRRAIRES
jgi:hypothetical protein